MVTSEKLRTYNTFVESGVARASRLATSEERLSFAIAELDRYIAEMLARQEERAEHMARDQAARHRELRNHIWVVGGLVIVTLGICTAIMIAVLL